MKSTVSFVLLGYAPALHWEVWKANHRLTRWYWL